MINLFPSSNPSWAALYWTNLLWPGRAGGGPVTLCLSRRHGRFPHSARNPPPPTSVDDDRRGIYQRLGAPVSHASDRPLHSRTLWTLQTNSEPNQRNVTATTDHGLIGILCTSLAKHLLSSAFSPHRDFIFGLRVAFGVRIWRGYVICTFIHSELMCLVLLSDNGQWPPPPPRESGGAKTGRKRGGSRAGKYMANVAVYGRKVRRRLIIVYLIVSVVDLCLIVDKWMSKRWSPWIDWRPDHNPPQCVVAVFNVLAMLTSSRWRRRRRRRRQQTQPRSRLNRLWTTLGYRKPEDTHELGYRISFAWLTFNCNHYHYRA